jgi:hypothetical protein
VRTKVTLALLFLNVALFFYIFKFEHAWRNRSGLARGAAPGARTETADIRILEVKSTSAAGIVPRRAR